MVLSEFRIFDLGVIGGIKVKLLPNKMWFKKEQAKVFKIE